MQPRAQDKEVKTVPSFTCGGKRQWCQGRSEHIDKSYLWQNDVKAWVLPVTGRGAFVLDGATRFYDKN